jgi:hypothetical protein
MSQIRHNFHNESEALINKQINMELQASYVYRSMVRDNFLIFCVTIVVDVPNLFNLF